MFLKSSAMESTFFVEMKERCKVFCVKIIALLIAFKEDTNTLRFHIFDYGAEYGAEFSAESGAE